MSDTTTITPEERAAIRSPSERWDALWYPHDRCHKMMLRLLTALEAAEARAEKAEANVARLTNERGWLAENAADRPCAYDSCPFGLHRPTGPDDDDCDKTRAQCWKEAARRAVGGGG